MIISRTPFRISFVGGGTDIPDFYQRHPGAVVSATINKFMYVSLNDFFEVDKIRAKYSITETVNNVDELKHPILKEVFRNYGIKSGIEIASLADIPGGTGMGSSSSFTVGVIHALRRKLGLPEDKEILAFEACHIEIEKLNEPIGRQDQYAASYGGFNHFIFNPHDVVERIPLNQDLQFITELEQNLLLFYTGLSRSASQVLMQQKKAILENENKFQDLLMIQALTLPFLNAFKKKDIKAMGQIIHENWLLKKNLTNSISDTFIDEAYNAALTLGAWGGKLLGAGGGGFFLIFAPPELHQKIIQRLSGFKRIFFKFEGKGSTIIYENNG